MKTLVLCVDRDNDVGVKTGIRGRLVGRDDCLAAAMKLGLADPEDADVNALLTAISIYDELLKSGQAAEVAAIAGDVRVGPVSDHILTQQLEDVLDEIKPARAYLVSDGAEDESIYPMIASRIRVDHVRRVFVRQNPALESTWYMLAKAWKDPKIARKFVVPFGLSLILFSLLWFISPGAAVPGIAFLIGLYVLWSAFSFHPREALERVVGMYDRVRTAPVTGNVSIFFNITAIIPFLIGIGSGVQAAGRQAEWVDRSLAFVIGSLFWFVLGFLLIEAGRAAEAFVKKGKVPRHVLIGGTGVVILSFAILGIVESIRRFQEPSGTVTFILVILGLATALLVVSGWSYRPRTEELPADSWRH